MTAHPDRIALSAAVGSGKWFAAAASIAIHVGLAGAVLVWDSSFEPPKPPAVLTVDLVIETALPGPAGPKPESPDTVSAAATVARTAPEMAEVEAEPAPAPKTISVPVSPPAHIAINGKDATPFQIAEKHPVAATVYAPLPKARPARKPVISPKPVTESLRNKGISPPSPLLQEARLPDADSSRGTAQGGNDASPGASLSPPTYAVPGSGNPAPQYPRAARRRGLEGKLVLRVTVDRDGRPDRLTVLESSGHSLLDDAARDAVSRWRFTAGMRGGAPISATVDVPIVFRLQAAR